jgi:predicted transcriptional regulator
MEALWNLGTATAEQVREALPDQAHDSTVRTLLRALETKGYVARDTRGKAYVYRPSVSRTKAQRAAVGGLLKRLFGGSAEDLVLRLLEDERITPEQLEEIRQATQVPSQPRRTTRGGGDPS